MVINKCLNQVSTQNLVSVSMYPNMLVISLSLALYHPKHNSNSTQITQFQLKTTSKQLNIQSFFLFELDLKTPSIFQNLLDCIFDSNSTQIQLNFNSKQLQNNSTFKVFSV